MSGACFGPKLNPPEFIPEDEGVDVAKGFEAATTPCDSSDWAAPLMLNIGALELVVELDGRVGLGANMFVEEEVDVEA